MKQSDQVVEVLKNLGGSASLAEIYNTVDTSNWPTQTPEASIRRIVRNDKRIATVALGVYCLAAQKANYENSPSAKPKVRNFHHTLYQALLIEIGNRNHDTYVAYHDKNKSVFDTGTLLAKSTLEVLPAFWPAQGAIPLKIMKRAKTVDVIWMDKGRKMPRAFYEVETTSDMKGSLQKFHELQDYRATMCIVAPQRRKREFNDIITDSAHFNIRGIVEFMSTEKLEKAAEEQRMETITAELWSALKPNK